MAVFVRRPLFGGYTLVAAAIAWVGGIALRAIGPLSAPPPLMWLALAAACALAIVVAALLRQRLARSTGTAGAGAGTGSHVSRAAA
ncbi:MAG TPA: hypothetical protein VF116_19990, partial [Ktedonobacterales bacterium]